MWARSEPKSPSSASGKPPTLASPRPAPTSRSITGTDSLSRAYGRRPLMAGDHKRRAFPARQGSAPQQALFVSPGGADRMRWRNLGWNTTVNSLMPESKRTWHFYDLARQTSMLAGAPATFFIACATVLVWAVTGPLFGFSDTWQLAINTGTTIVTFLMVFLLQNTQNHDARALHLKLDELLRSLKSARNSLIDLEECTDEEIEQLEQQFRAFSAREARQRTSGEGVRSCRLRDVSRGG